MTNRQRCVAAVLVAVAFLAALPVGAIPPPQQQYDGQEGSDSGCYCGIVDCGCAAAAPGRYLEASCTCGTTCTRTCTYKSLKTS
jgi:hypothetical protein